MTLSIENTSYARRRSHRQLLFQSDGGCNLSAASKNDEGKHNSRVSSQSSWIFSVRSSIFIRLIIMHKSTKAGLIAVAILICVILVIVLLNLESIKPTVEDTCIRLDGNEVCHSTDPSPYRFYSTKTAYNIAAGNNTNFNLDVGECEPKLFYLLSRHATRYPDKDDIVEMIKVLPELRDGIINSSLHARVNMCKDDLEKLKNWSVTMEPENDNKLSVTGENEAMDLARRYKKKFSSILNQTYSPDKFTFEYTSRERTRSTAESFAKGLFGEDYKEIDFEKKTNDKVLQFHKECKKLKKSCKHSPDLSEIDSFVKGPLLQKVVDSISKRVGFAVTLDEVTIAYKACTFGYALDIGDAWCALFSSDELKVLEFGDDIDDYYKDSYGNKINYEQACPVVQYIVNLFKSSLNTTDRKSVFHFSHAGGIKKVYPIFGLFHDEKPLTANYMCSQLNRKWRSSLIAPFTSNIAFVLYECKNKLKIVAFHNEKPILLGGCKSTMCSFEEFYIAYNSIAENCDINKICCTCCKY